MVTKYQILGSSQEKTDSNGIFHASARTRAVLRSLKWWHLWVRINRNLKFSQMIRLKGPLLKNVATFFWIFDCPVKGVKISEGIFNLIPILKKTEPNQASPSWHQQKDLVFIKWKTLFQKWIDVSKTNSEMGWNQF